ncbi:MAG: GSCFA domain-containing protein [Bacteroidota bacterium]
MKRYTNVQIPTSEHSFGYDHALLTMGSCFAESMGKRLENRKFKVLNNPLGIAYNPLSLFRLLEIIIGNHKPTILQHEQLGYYFSFDLHSQWIMQREETFEKGLQQRRESTLRHLRECSHLILTFGTAHVYQLASDQQLVNNCHKYPGHRFHREMLKPEAIVEGFQQIRSQLLAINPNLTIILTLSPIRHIRDGLSTNSLSKSILRYAIESCSQEENVIYFPSYEIMLDELRDYRYYEKDLIHPNEQGESYIWERFKDTFLEEGSNKLMEEWEKLKREFDHKPLHNWSPSYYTFMEKLIEKLEKLQKKGINLEEEIGAVRLRMKIWEKNYGSRQKK